MHHSTRPSATDGPETHRTLDLDFIPQLLKKMVPVFQSQLTLWTSLLPPSPTLEPAGVSYTATHISQHTRFGPCSFLVVL